MPSNWPANRIELRLQQLARKVHGGNSTKKPGHEGKHGLEQRTALNLERMVTNKHTEGPGQMGHNTYSVRDLGQRNQTPDQIQEVSEKGALFEAVRG